MSRMNIFDMLFERWDLSTEMQRIARMVKEDLYIGEDMEHDLFDFCDEYCFKTWKHRHRCVNCADFEKALGITIKKDTSWTVDSTIVYLEYLLNIIALCDAYCEQNPLSTDVTDDRIILMENITSILDHLNYTTIQYKDEQKVLLIEKSASVSAVVEVVQPELAMQIIEYNHYTMKGDVGRKKKILLALGEKLESVRKDITPSQLEQDVFFMLNNLNVRHNNVEISSKNYRNFTAQMTPKVLEEWYDELYQAALLALLSVDHKERAMKIGDLKSNYK